MRSITYELLGAAVSEISLCAIYLLSSAGEVMSWNRGASQLKGWCSREINGFHFSVFYDEEERARGVPEENLSVARTTGKYVGEGWRIRRDGSVFRASVEIEHIGISGDEKISFIQIVRDISNQYQERMALSLAQQVISRREADLTEANNTLDGVFSLAPCSLILCNISTGDIVRANPAATHSPWLTALVRRGSVITRTSADGWQDDLSEVLQRGLYSSASHSFSETFSSREPATPFSLKISADKITPETILFTIMDVTAEYEAVTTATHQALHDPLTGLLNRRGLMPALEELLKNGTPFAVMISDIDRFKSVNDVLGHPAGDALLVEVSARLLSTLRPGDILARTGGDEFVAVLPGIDSPASSGEIASRLTESLQKPYILGGRKVLSGCSFGVCLCPSSGAEDAESMLSAADIALYSAKSSGRNSYVIFSDKLASLATERFSLENDLREALGKGEMQLVYQPVVNSVTEEVVSYEALLRWLHPIRGNVSPEIFIPLAEKTGLIHDMGVFVLNQACNELAASPDGERVAVNLSPLQFRNPQLNDSVKNALLNSGLHPHRLELEITESALMENPEDSYRVIHEFRGMGIHMVLDDFGTGFSSLSHLRSNLFSRIKIDRSFISDLNHDASAAAIVSSILSLCHQLGLEVTAEGVETPDQADWLRSHGCTLLQGFLYGRPMPRRMI